MAADAAAMNLVKKKLLLFLFYFLSLFFILFVNLVRRRKGAPFEAKSHHCRAISSRLELNSACRTDWFQTSCYCRA